MRTHLEEYYQQCGTDYRMSSTRRLRVLTLLDQAMKSVPDSASILDIGIGSGEIAKHVRQRSYGSAVHIEGIDIAENVLLEHADDYDRRRIVNVDQIGWTEQFDRLFDVVVAAELVEHLFRPDLFFSSVREVLKPSGFLVLSTPNMLLWSHRIKLLLGKHGYTDKGVFEWGHLHLFSWKFLKQTLARSRFSIRATNHLLYPNSLGRVQKIISPGLFAFQFILLAQKK